MALFRQTLRLATMTRSVPVALYHEKVTTSSITEFKCKISGESLLGPFLNIVKLPRNFDDTSIIELQDAITFPCEGDRPLREPAQRRQDGPQEEERGHGAGGRACLRRRHEAADRG